jgi:two-component system, OmpR family, catabolic regulation response regulator CreB
MSQLFASPPVKTHLLLLEDDPAIAQTVVYVLSREGFEVESVGTVSQAQASLLRAPGQYSAAILDVGLPDGSGLDLCRLLRQQGGSLASLPVIMLTARGEEFDRVLGLELGADDYLTKPFSTRELCARVRALLRRAGTQAAPPAKPETANTLTCNELDQRARLGPHDLPLTRREFGLLSTLLKHPGRIWSRDALLDAVWGMDADSTDRTVDTHIKTLRAKLREAGGDEDLIQTHRGLGYGLDVSKL